MNKNIKEKIQNYIDTHYNGSLKRLRDSNLGKFLTGSEVKIIRDYVDEELQTPTSRMIYCFLNDIQKHPKCPCGNYVDFDQVRKRFRPFCSVKCQKTLFQQTVEKRTATCMERYGNRSYIGSKEGINKTKEVCLEKYGVDSFSKTEEFKTLRKSW